MALCLAEVRRPGCYNEDEPELDLEMDFSFNLTFTALLFIECGDY